MSEVFSQNNVCQLTYARAHTYTYTQARTHTHTHTHKDGSGGFKHVVFSTVGACQRKSMYLVHRRGVVRGLKECASSTCLFVRNISCPGSNILLHRWINIYDIT